MTSSANNPQLADRPPTALLAGYSLVVGGSKGLGLHFATTLLEMGCEVHLFSRTPPPGGGLAQHCGHSAVDLLDPDDVDTALTELVRTRGLPTALAFYQRSRASADTWGQEYGITLLATRQIIEWVAARHPDGSQLSVVIVASLAARLVAHNQEAEYHVFKAALEQLARFYAARLGPRGIRVNVVSPGMVFKERARDWYQKNLALAKQRESFIPLRRMATEADVTEAVLFLSGERSSYITGQTLVVDGGLSLHLQESLLQQVLDLTGPGPA